MIWKTNNKERLNEGSSFLEIVIAMLVLSMAVAGSFSLNVTSQRFLTDAQRKLQAEEKAFAVIEQLSQFSGADREFSDFDDIKNNYNYIPNNPNDDVKDLERYDVVLNTAKMVNGVRVKTVYGE
jgi:hypothetical protein